MAGRRSTASSSSISRSNYNNAVVVHKKLVRRSQSLMVVCDAGGTGAGPGHDAKQCFASPSAHAVEAAVTLGSTPGTCAPPAATATMTADALVVEKVFVDDTESAATPVHQDLFMDAAGGDLLVDEVDDALGDAFSPSVGFTGAAGRIGAEAEADEEATTTSSSSSSIAAATASLSVGRLSARGQQTSAGVFWLAAGAAAVGGAAVIAQAALSGTAAWGAHPSSSSAGGAGGAMLLSLAREFGVRASLTGPLAWQTWQSFEHGHPWLAASLLTGVSYALADTFAQSIAARKAAGGGAVAAAVVKPKLDPWSTVRSAAAGALFLGPLAHAYYHLQDDAFTLLLGPEPPAWMPILKVALDQTAYSATYNAVYFFTLGLMRGESPGAVAARFRSVFWHVMRSGWRLWPLVHCVTYTVIPTQHKLLWVDAVEVVWVTFLATVASGDAHAPPPQPSLEEVSAAVAAEVLGDAPAVDAAAVAEDM